MEGTNDELKNDNDFLNEDYSPLDSPVKQRAYTKPNIDESEINYELEEPVFEAPSFSDIEPEQEESYREPEKPFNQSFSELDNKEKAMGAEMMADMVIDIYEKGCGWLGKIPKFNEKEIDELMLEGTIDRNITLPTNSGNIPIKEFAQEYNNTIAEAFEVNDEFKEKVRPPMIRVFKKRGVGMTDEQLLMYYFGTDIATKGAQAFMLRRETNNIKNYLKEMTVELREQRLREDRPITPTPTYSNGNSEPNSYAPNQTSSPNPPITPSSGSANSNNSGDFVEDFTYVDAPEPTKPRERRTAPKPKRTKKTNLDEQVEFMGSDSTFDILNSNGGFTEDFNDLPNMPQFGDSQVIADLDRIAQMDSDLNPPTRKANKGRGSRKK